VARAVRAIVVLALSLGALGGCARRPSIPEIEDQRQPQSAALIEALSARSAARRARAALAMGRIQSPAYADALVEATRDGDKSVRLAALFALGQLGLVQEASVPGGAIDGLLPFLDDEDPDLVAMAVEALGKLAGARVPSAVVPLLGHAAPAVRSAAALALFRCRFAPLWRGEVEEPPPLPDAAVEALITALDDTDPAVRRDVVYAFSRYGQAEAAVPLGRFLTDEDEWVRLFAGRAIGNSGRAEAADALLPALGDPSARVRAEGVTALAALHRQQAIPEALAADGTFHVRAALARALGSAAGTKTLDTLRQLERDPSATVRAAAIVALAGRLGVGYRADLEAWLGDGDWRMRAAAAGAAGQLRDGRLALVRRALADGDARVRVAALGALEGLDSAADLLIEALGADDLAVRGTAVGLLAELEHPQKLESLSAAYEGSGGVEWIEVREAIAEAVADLSGSDPLLLRMASDAASSVQVKALAALAARGIEPPARGTPPAPQPPPAVGAYFEEDPVVVLETTRGEIRIRCWAREAPHHVASFVARVRQGFYDGLVWHRVVTNFVIQGGDPRGDGWGSGGYTLRDEINRVAYGRGAVGMPKAGKDTGGCQIFITHLPTPHLDGNYTVFGQVIAGLEAVDAIEVGDRIVRARLARPGE